MPAYYKDYLEVSFNKFPIAKDWKVGNTYEVILKVRQMGVGEEGTTFEVLTAKSKDSAKPKVTYDE